MHENSKKYWREPKIGRNFMNKKKLEEMLSKAGKQDRLKIGRLGNTNYSISLFISPPDKECDSHELLTSYAKRLVSRKVRYRFPPLYRSFPAYTVQQRFPPKSLLLIAHGWVCFVCLYQNIVWYFVTNILLNPCQITKTTTKKQKQNREFAFLRICSQNLQLCRTYTKMLQAA